MATLTGTTIQSTYDSLLKVTDNDSITGSLKRITDGLGNNTPLYLSSSAVEIVSTLNVTSTITGSNLSGTNTGDETKASIETKLGAATSSNSGYLTSTDWSTFSNKIAGSGTLNTIPKFSSSSSIGNSNITDTGTLITLGSSSYVNGALGIGTAAGANNTLRIQRNLTSSTTAYGIFNSNIVQSDVTATVYQYLSQLNTQAAAFNLSTFYHYAALQGTIGAGSTITTQVGFISASTLISATNNYGFQGAIPSGLNNYNLFMSGTARNYLAGDTAIGVSQLLASSGPILTATLTNGGSGYVDGTYTDVLSTNITGLGLYAYYTVVVSGGIVTSVTLTWGGVNWRVGDTMTISNTLLGGTGSGLVITAATVDSSQLKIANVNGGDITLYRSDTSMVAGENIGSIKFENNDASLKASGIHAEISALGGGNAGGAYLSFLTRSTVAGSSLVEGLRILPDANVFIPTTALGIGSSSLTGYALRIGKNITGATVSYGIRNTGVIQSDVTSTAIYYDSTPATQATAFTLDTLVHYRATQGTLGAGSAITTQYGIFISSSLTGATNNYGLYSDILSATGRWNLYMNGTASNYLNGTTLIGSTFNISANYKLQVTGNIYTSTGLSIGLSTLAPSLLGIGTEITGATTAYGVNFEGSINSAVTTNAMVYRSYPIVTGGTLGAITHYTASKNAFIGGSTVTNQYGFFADASVSGATNNYGFYGNIAAATGAWNLYMNGTAQNYINGNLGIGVAVPTVKLDVSGAGLFSSSVTASSFIKSGGTSAQLLAGDGSVVTAGTNITISGGTISSSGGLSGSGTTNYVAKFTGSSAIGNSQIFDNGTNVGIGTSSPASRLSVWNGEITISNLDASYTVPMGSVGAYNADATNGGLIFKTSLSGTLAEKVRIQNNGYVGIGTTTPAVLLDINSSTTNDRLVLSHTGSPKCVFGVTSAGANFLYHHTTGTFPIYINAAGNFGINTASPNEKLSVIGAISANNGMIVQGYSAAASGLNVEMGVVSGYAQFNAYNRSTSAYGQFRLDGSSLILNAGSGGNVGIGTSSPSAKLSVAGDITVLSTGAAIAGSTESIYFAGTSNGNYLAFGTNSNERARIANDGRFQVNNTGYSANCTATLRALTGTSTDKILECMTISYSSAFYVRNDGNYYFSGSNLSDARTKKDINYLEESILDKVMKLKPASFRYKENEENIKGGFIAQDIKEIFPDLVTSTKSDDEMMGVDYYGVIAILTKAIQELTEKVNKLENK